MTHLFPICPFLLLVSTAVLYAAEPVRPHKNVLFIVADDLNMALGCYGHPVVKTPNIDALARQGVRFDRAYCQVSVCNPSRASFLTGLRPARTGVHDNEKSFRAQRQDILTLPQHFKQHGYWTGAVGKLFHHGNDDGKSWSWLQPWADETHRETKGAQAWNLNEIKMTRGDGRNVTGGRLPWAVWRSVESGQLIDERSTDLAIRQIKGFTREQPFFLGVGFIRPHDLFFAPKEYFDMYPLDSIKLPLRDETGIPRAAYGIKEWKDVYETLNDHDRKELLRAWYACVSFMDAQVGKVLDAVKQQGLADNTIVVLTSDHGYHNWEKDWWGKCTVWELSARVPLIVAGSMLPRKDAGCDRVVELLDLAPTLVDLAGLPPMPGRDGRSLMPLLANPALSDDEWNGAAFTEFGSNLRSVRTGRWRYCQWGAEEALYDHQTDSQEANNLVGKPGFDSELSELRKLLARVFENPDQVKREGETTPQVP